MDFSPILQELQKHKIAGRKYQREGHQRFRDVVTVCRNGKFKFERFCYGEAASLVCTMWAQRADDEGNIQWDYDACQYTGKTEAPVQLTAIHGEKLELDAKRLLWEPSGDLKNVPGSGMGVLSGLFKK